jgi:branched-chain amino acid transport system permease protein
VIQVLVNGMVFGATSALYGLAVACIFRTARFADFTVGVVIVVSAYFTYFAHALLGYGLVASAVFAVICSTAVGVSVLTVLRRWIGAGEETALRFLLGSLAVYVVAQNAVALAFGDKTLSLADAGARSGFSIPGARIGETQLVAFCVPVLAVTCAEVLLSQSRAGRLIRAVGDDPALAYAVGVRVTRVVLLAACFSYTLAAIGGVLAAYQSDLKPTMGFRPFLVGLVTFVLGGGAIRLGPIVAGMALGIALHTTLWHVSAEWQDTVLAVVLLLVLPSRYARDLAARS